MANTKTKKAKKDTYDICPLQVREESEWEKHVFKCGRKRGQKRVECSHCEYATSKKSDMNRRCGRAMADTLKLTARVEKTGSSLILGLSRMLWVKQLLKLLPGVTKRNPTTSDAVYTPKVDKQAIWRKLHPLHLSIQWQLWEGMFYRRPVLLVYKIAACGYLSLPMK